MTALELTEIRRPPLVPEVRLCLAVDVTALWKRLAGNELPPDECFPYWAVAWAGGQALARYVLDHPEEVADRQVLDFAAGSGLCAIAAMKSGAAETVAVDLDARSRRAIRRNAELNGVAVSSGGDDLVDCEPPSVDVVLAGDVCYERTMASRVVPWLRSAHESGIRVLVGDPGREYFPRSGLTCLAQYEVPTPRDVEGVERKQTGVYTFSMR